MKKKTWNKVKTQKLRSKTKKNDVLKFVCVFL